MAPALGGMIRRDPPGAAAERYDLIVVGGGVYGIMLTLEAARRGIRVLLLERRDFGGGTSWNSLRIVHGGLRYLQTLDLPRFQESIGERRWFLRTFPDLVSPLPCLMPLYGRGLKRPSVLRVALGLNDALSAGRNRGVAPDRRLPRGRVLSAAETVAHTPAIGRAGLEGAASWYDAAFVSSQRVLMECLRWASAVGAAALNYVEATRIVTNGGRVVGVVGRDVIANAEYEFRAERVANCAGPGVEALARSADRQVPSLFPASLAFNLVLDRDPLFEGGLAVEPPRTGGPVYFLVPWQGRVCAGTYHAAVTATPVDPSLEAEAHLEAMLADLNAALPGWALDRNAVVRILAGLLPATRPGAARLATRAVIHDHGSSGGPAGLVSVSGVKFTTARLVAEHALARLVPASRSTTPSTQRPAPAAVPDAAAFRKLLQHDVPRARAIAGELVRTEAALRLDDLLLRRTDWGMLPDRTGFLEAALADVMRPPARALP